MLRFSVRIEAPLGNKNASQEVVSSGISCWANPKPGVLHEQPSSQGWIFEADDLSVTRVRGKPRILEIYSRNKNGRVFPACSYLWGKFGEGLKDGDKFSATGRSCAPEMAAEQFIFVSIAVTRQGGIPSFDLEHSLPAKHRKKYF